MTLDQVKAEMIKDLRHHGKNDDDDTIDLREIVRTKSNAPDFARSTQSRIKYSEKVNTAIK